MVWLTFVMEKTNCQAQVQESKTVLKTKKKQYNESQSNAPRRDKRPEVPLKARPLRLPVTVVVGAAHPMHVARVGLI